ncbi:YbaY family lipoprotein [Shewanella chilikensis]|uniref:YbaY family lipoprotein n=1 Tax=Shewanella chilikensis TaxID=558541 RepID=UPI00398C5DDB
MKMTGNWLRLPMMAAVAGMMALTGCATPNATVEIDGDVWYRERIALPPEAVLTVQVQDVSKADAPAEVLAVIQRDSVTSPTPFKFILARDQFQSGHSYSISARITLKDDLLFINTQAYPVNIDKVEPVSVMVQKVGR